jgi:hypothetical protein
MGCFHNRDHWSRLYILLFAATGWGVAGGAEPAGQSPKREPTQGRGAAGILIDAIHANEFSTIGLKPGVYTYHHFCGSRFGFEYLQSRGVRCDRVSEGRLDAQRLSRYRLLFINLASAERPPFLVSEIAAIRSFVSGGGSLLVVTEHTNAYFHAHVLQPLLTELDIDSFTGGVCEEPPETLGIGNGWITVTRFKPHPVTSGLTRIALQSGGCVDPRFAVALTGERSWADAWRTSTYGEENAPAFSGNFVRDPGEKPGPLGVVLAKTLGSGRIVIVGDQNMISDTFINYADNYRLWLNSMAWLLGDDRLREREPYELWRKPRILMVEQFDRPAFGVSDLVGCYHVWVLLSRHYWAFAGDRLSPPGELIVVAYNDCPIPAETAAAMAVHLRCGKNVLVLNADSATLFDELGVVARVLRAAGVKEPKRLTRPGKLILELPGAGAIHVLGPDRVLDNGTLAPPTRAPTPAEQQRNDALLDAVREALGRP